MTARAFTLASCMVLAAAYLGFASKTEAIPVREPLSRMPLTVGKWHGRLERDFDAKIVEVLGVDDYTSRTYTVPGESTIGLYVGYHSSQRQGDTIHSPLNCLPGAGWTPVSQDRTKVLVSDNAAGEPRPIEINRVIIQKGLDRHLVLYWYQSHRRVVASEYWGKVYTVVDAIRYNRTDAALVRVIVPITGVEASVAQRAEAHAIAFVQAIYPALGRHLPA